LTDDPAIYFEASSTEAVAWSRLIDGESRDTG
jgi:hypothetical protein